jgi:hypothetical protein
VTNQICQENATSAADPGGGFGVLDPPFTRQSTKIPRKNWTIMLENSFELNYHFTRGPLLEKINLDLHVPGLPIYLPPCLTIMNIIKIRCLYSFIFFSWSVFTLIHLTIYHVQCMRSYQVIFHSSLTIHHR